MSPDDILIVSRNWMRGFDHLYKKIRPISISCHPTFHAPELLKSKYYDWEDHQHINKKSSQSDTMKQRIVRNPYLKKKSSILLGKQEYEEMIQMCFKS